MGWVSNACGDNIGSGSFELAFILVLVVIQLMQVAFVYFDFVIKHFYTLTI